MSHQLIKTQNTTEATLAATIAKAQRDVEEVASKTVGTFFETKTELDHMRLQVENRIIEVEKGTAKLASELDPNILVRKFTEHD